MDEGDTYQVRVFTGPRALGNATGVVATRGVALDKMLPLAARLGFPDTAFLHLPALPGGHWRVDSYSPFEPLRVCTQTLLASYWVLAENDLLAADGVLVAQTAAGPIAVRPAIDGPVPAFVELPVSATPHRRPATLPPLPELALSDPLIVDTGRPRLYCRLDPYEMELVELVPQRVVEFCRAEHVNGICLVALGGGAIRMRVFTTSLGGGEDAGTGGAAAGLVGYARAAGWPFAQGTARLVRQGRGNAVMSAELYVRSLADAEDKVAVGGRVEPIVVGRLAHGQLTSTR